MRRVAARPDFAHYMIEEAAQTQANPDGNPCSSEDLVCALAHRRLCGQRERFSVQLTAEVREVAEASRSLGNCRRR